MIWVFLFLIFFLFNLKDSLFFSNFFFLDRSRVFIRSISPLVLYVILSIFMCFGSSMDMKFYKFGFNLLVGTVTITFLVSDCLRFLIFLEITIFPMALLIFFFSKDLDKVSSIMFIMFINILGSLPFIAFVWFYTSNFRLLTQNMGLTLSLTKDLLIYFRFFLVLICKLPFFILHFWLTKAHVRASGSCSMLLASLMLKLGSFGLLKFSNIFFVSWKNFFPLIFSLSLIGPILFSLVMVRFFDMKFLIACSSVLHMSLIFPFISMGRLVGKISSVFIITGHGLVSYFLFFIVTLFYEGSFNRSFDFNKSVESLNKSVCLFTFIFIFFNLGLPPFINFLRELYFCSVFILYSMLRLVIFSIFIVCSIIFTIMLITKIVFGKKVIFFFIEYNIFFNFTSFIYSTCVILLIFLRCFFSL